MSVILKVDEGDVVKYDADVLMLKFAARFFGADLNTAGLLGRAGVRREEMTPGEDGFKLVEAGKALNVQRVLFVSVPPPGEFDLNSLREFMVQGLHLIKSAGVRAAHIITTLHGPGFGLEERPAFNAQLDGVLSALAAGQCPKSLARITIVEANPARVHAMRDVLMARMAKVAGAVPSNDGFRVAF